MAARVSRKKRRIVHNRDGGRCQYCYRHWSEFGIGDWLTVDHVVPRCQGGTNDLSNLVSCCTSCNQMKSRECDSVKAMAIPHEARPLRRDIRPCIRCGFPMREIPNLNYFCINALCPLTYFKWAVDSTQVLGGKNYQSEDLARLNLRDQEITRLFNTGTRSNYLEY